MSKNPKPLSSIETPKSARCELREKGSHGQTAALEESEPAHKCRQEIEETFDGAEGHSPALGEERRPSLSKPGRQYERGKREKARAPGVEPWKPKSAKAVVGMRGRLCHPFFSQFGRCSKPGFGKPSERSIS